METIAFDTLGLLDPAKSHSVTPLPAVFTLWNVWIHVSTLNHRNEASNVEASIDQTFSLCTALDILDIDPDNRHIRFRRDLNDPEL